MTRQRLVAVAAAVTSLVTGCSAGAAPGGSPGTAGAPATITWWASPFAASGSDPRMVMIDAFERAHPSIRVTLISGPTNTDKQRETLASEVAGGTGPDVYNGDVVWPATFGHAGLALPLSDHLPGAFWNRFTPSLLPGVTYNRKIYAAPFFRTQGLLYYRKDLLAQEHFPVPQTWEQLVVEAAAIKAAGLVKYGFVWQGARYEGLTCVWTEVMKDAGGQVLNGAGTRSLIDSTESLTALRFLRKLVLEGVTPAEVATFEELDVSRIFDSGQAAFARQWNSGYTAAMATTSSVSADVGVAPLPAFDGRPNVHYSTFGGTDLSINPHTRNLDAALTFIQWLTDVSAQRIMATAYSMIPANRRVPPSGPVETAVYGSRPVSRPPNTPTYTAVSSAIFTNVNDAIKGTLTPEAALEAADRQIDAAVSNGS
jgi:multiple sugar transport system substrate-binding protein